MADSWFRLPNETRSTNGPEFHRPEYVDQPGVRGYSGVRPGQSSRWLVRVFGDAAGLDAVASEADATAVTATAAAQTMAAGGEPDPAGGWTAKTINERFRVST